MSIERTDIGVGGTGVLVSGADVKADGTGVSVASHGVMVGNGIVGEIHQSFEKTSG